MYLPSPDVGKTSIEISARDVQTGQTFLPMTIWGAPVLSSVEEENVDTPILLLGASVVACSTSKAGQKPQAMKQRGVDRIRQRKEEAQNKSGQTKTR